MVVVVSGALESCVFVSMFEDGDGRKCTALVVVVTY